MTEDTESLWPSDMIDSSAVSPKAILTEAAEQLAAKTSGILKAKVVQMRGILDDVEEGIEWAFSVSAPALGYTYELFRMRIPMSLYPVEIEHGLSDSGETERWSVPDSEQVRTAIRYILALDRAKKVISGLMAQSEG